MGKGTNLIDELVFEEWDVIEAASIAGSNTHTDHNVNIESLVVEHLSTFNKVSVRVLVGKIVIGRGLSFCGQI